MSNAVFYFQQMGSAVALLPLLRAIEGKAPFECISIGPAKTYLDSESIESHEVANISEALKVAEGIDFSVLISGTSWDGYLDTQLWQLAKDKKAKVVAYVDKPVNLDLRFKNGLGSFQFPDLLLVPFASVAEEIRGFFSEQELPEIRVIEGLSVAGEVQKLTKATVDYQRTGRILFASEPQPHKFVIMRYLEENGFIDEDILRDLVTVVRESDDLSLVVRLHPMDTEDRIDGLLEGTGVDYVFEKADMESIRQNIDWVVGMRSMWLYTTAACGVPTVSYQPKRKTEYPLFDNYSPIRTLTDKNMLRDILQQTKVGKRDSDFELASQVNQRVESLLAELLS